MPRSSGFSVKKPVSVWNREVKVNFRDLFKALGKAVVSAKVAKFDVAINSLVDSVAAFELKKDAGQLAWLLIYRSISRAMFMLIEDNLLLIREATRGFQTLAGKVELSEENLKAIADKLDYAVDARDLTIDRNFFERPRDFAVIEDLKKPLAEWLESFGLNSSQAHSIAGRFPSYFVFALNDEWRTRRADYNLVTEELSTPFTKAAEIEQAWSHYYAWLQKRVDEPLFQEAFSLRQIYIPLRAYFEKRKETKSDERFSEGDVYFNRNIEKVVVDLERELEDWVDNSDEKEAIRILSGGPGYGKSSVAKMFAARQTEKNNRRVLFIPLHLLYEPTDDLVNSVKKFVESEGFFPSAVNFLHPTEGENRLLLIFDGLDELSMQGKVGNEVAQQFVKEIQRKVDIFNRREPRLKILICGRDISIQASANDLDRKTKVLNLLPYYLVQASGYSVAGYTSYLVNDEKIEFFDPENILDEDQRHAWWNKYGEINGKSYKSLPKEVSGSNLTEITTLPLLNYLVALSHARGKIDFTQTNLNLIYQDLLESVYQREDVWADNQHTILQGIKQDEFFRILEEIALAAWHGEGRKVSVKEIERHCESSGLKPLLEKFQEKAKDGISSLLVAFYFKKSGGFNKELNETFEFTHKSFGEYLTARRIIREVHRISREMKIREETYEGGWNEVEALTQWMKLSRITPIDEYLLDFIRNEVAIYQKEIVSEWQKSFSRLVNHVLRFTMPMEKLADERPNFRDEMQQARNAETALLTVLNACSLKLTATSDISFPDKDSFRKTIHWLDSKLAERVLSFLNFQESNLYNIYLDKVNFEQSNLSKANLARGSFEGANLSGANLAEANLASANFSDANLRRANLSYANLNYAYFQNARLTSARIMRAKGRGAILDSTDFTEANLKEAFFKEARLENANLFKANLFGANLEWANLNNAKLSGADLTGASLYRANLENASLVGASLRNADMEGANLKNANLTGANLEGTILYETKLDGVKLEKANLFKANLYEISLKGINLQGVVWVDGRRIIGGEYPDLIFADGEPEK